jgi:hypothetical protein
LAWELIKEGLGEPNKMAIPAILLLGIFGSALVYLTVLVFKSWPVLIGSVITFTYGVRPLFKRKDDG